MKSRIQKKNKKKKKMKSVPNPIVFEFHYK